MLILVRHGRTALNAAGRLQGRIDEPLDDVGRKQAAIVAEHVGPVDLLLSSPLRRATETAAAFGIPYETDERWIELSYGIFEGVAVADTPSEAWDRWQDDVDYVPSGGESLAALDVRVRERVRGPQPARWGFRCRRRDPCFADQVSRGVGPGGDDRHLLAFASVPGVDLSHRDAPARSRADVIQRNRSGLGLIAVRSGSPGPRLLASQSVIVIV